MKNKGASEVRERLHFEREMMDLELGAKNSPLTKTPIIFIPGVPGSELSRGGQTVWPTNNYETAQSLHLDDNGEDIGDPVVPTRVWREFIPIDSRYVRIPIYERFFAFFREKGYLENINLFEFPYDWRKDTEISSLRLSLLVLDVARTAPHKVILMAHSLGGMVVRSLMRNPSIHKHIEKVFLFGTPQHGSPTYLSLLLFGKNWPFTYIPWIGPRLPSGLLPIVDLKERDAKHLVRNFPSIYINAMDFTSKFPLIFESNRPVSAQQLRSLHPGQYNDWMIERSIRFHEELNRSWDRFPFYNTFLLVTLDIPTINAIHMKRGRFDRFDYTSPVRGLGPGDKTIPGFSTTQIIPGKTHTHVFDRAIPGAREGWNVKHQDLPTTDAVLLKVFDIMHSKDYTTSLGPIPVWELRNKSQEAGPGPLMIDDPRRDIVIHLQTALVALGFGIGTSKPDGILGPSTTKAVKEFQDTNTDFTMSAKLETDGIVGPLTADAINRALVGKWYGATGYFTPKILVIHYDKLRAGAAIPMQPLPGKPFPRS